MTETATGSRSFRFFDREGTEGAGVAHFTRSAFVRNPAFRRPPPKAERGSAQQSADFQSATADREGAPRPRVGNAP